VRPAKHVTRASSLADCACIRDTNAMTIEVSNPTVSLDEKREGLAADYFSLMGLPKKLNIDLAKLQHEFYRLSRQLHPDAQARAGTENQHENLDQSSQLNDAYRTLKDAIKRTQYLLHLEGVELEEQSKSATEAARTTGQVKKQIVPPGLLEEVFELNMQLEELRMNQKMGEEDPALIEEVAKQKLLLEEKHEALSTELGSYWNEWDDANSDADRAQARDHMVDLLNRRTYIRNLVRDVNEVLDTNAS
jgi:molecular chaperone HscB